MSTYGLAKVLSRFPNNVDHSRISLLALSLKTLLLSSDIKVFLLSDLKNKIKDKHKFYSELQKKIFTYQMHHLRHSLG